MALPGIWFVSQEPDLADGPARGGVGDGVLAGLGFGTLFAALGQIPESAGLLPLAFNQLVAGAVIVAVALALRVDWVPRERAALVGLWCGALAAAATGAFLIATQHGELTITAVLASLYPAFTILLAASVLRERIHPTQGVGLALCGLAVVLVAIALGPDWGAGMIGATEQALGHAPRHLVARVTSVVRPDRRDLLERPVVERARATTAAA